MTPKRTKKIASQLLLIRVAKCSSCFVPELCPRFLTPEQVLVSLRQPCPTQRDRHVLFPILVLALLGAEQLNAVQNGDFSVWTSYKGSGVTTQSVGTPPGSLPDDWYGGPGVGGKATYDGVDFDLEQTEVPGQPKRFLRVHWHAPPAKDWSGEAHHQGVFRFTFLEYFGIKDVRVFAGKTVVMSFWARVDRGELDLIPIMWHSYDGQTAGIAGVKGKGYELFESSGQQRVIAVASGKPNPAAVCRLTPKWMKFEKQIALPSIGDRSITAGHYTGVGFDLDSRFAGSIDLAKIEVRVVDEVKSP